MKSFEGKVVFITGAGEGLGRALSLQFADEKAILALADWNRELLNETVELVTQRGCNAKAFFVDVSNRKQVFDVADHVIDEFKKIDILINNAGIGPSVIKFGDMDMDKFEQMVNINMWGTIYCTKAFLPHLLKQPEASIVNVGSLNSIIGYGGASHYCTAKFGIRGFTESLWFDLAKSRVKVTLVHPGKIKTQIMLRSPDYASDQDRQEAQEQFDNMMGGVSAEKAAKIIIKGIKKKKKRILIGKETRILAMLSRIFFTSYTWFVQKFAKLAGFEI